MKILLNQVRKITVYINLIDFYSLWYFGIQQYICKLLSYLTHWNLFTFILLIEFCFIFVLFLFRFIISLFSFYLIQCMIPSISLFRYLVNSFSMILFPSHVLSRSFCFFSLCPCVSIRSFARFPGVSVLDAELSIPGKNLYEEGVGLMKGKNWKEAAECFEKTIKLGNVNAMTLLGSLYL